MQHGQNITISKQQSLPASIRDSKSIIYFPDLFNGRDRFLARAGRKRPGSRRPPSLAGEPRILPRPRPSRRPGSSLRRGRHVRHGRERRSRRLRPRRAGKSRPHHPDRPGPPRGVPDADDRGDPASSLPERNLQTSHGRRPLRIPKRRIVGLVRRKALPGRRGVSMIKHRPEEHRRRRPP